MKQSKKKKPFIVGIIENPDTRPRPSLSDLFERVNQSVELDPIVFTEDYQKSIASVPQKITRVRRAKKQ